MFNSLEFDGINSLNNGIYITGESVYDAPERDVQAVEIAGRSGDFLLDNGRWKNIDITYHCGTFGADKSEFSGKIRNYLGLLKARKGYKRLQDSYNPNEFRMGICRNAVEVEPVAYKQAGEFDLVFNCKPQRYLTSGDTEQTITSGTTLTNPTPYDASPMLLVKGSGAINFNGHTINLRSATLGKIVLNENSQNLGATFTIPINHNLHNSGDSMYIDGLKIQWTLLGSEPYPEPTTTVDTLSSATTTSSAFNYNTGSATDPEKMGRVFQTAFSSITIPLASDSTISNFSRTSWRISSVDENGVNCNQTITYTAGTSEGTLTIEATLSTAPASMVRQSQYIGIGQVYINSTVSTAVNSLYIDCDMGNAYMVKSGEYISMNNTVDFGTDLPTLAPGTNTVTFANTITELKITPRWWTL